MKKWKKALENRKQLPNPISN